MKQKKAKLKGLVKDLKALDRRLIIRAKNTGSFLTVRVTIVTGTVLAATEFCDFLCTSYDGTLPPNLQKFYGLYLSFSVCNILSCCSRDFYIAYHRKCCCKFLQFAVQAFSYTCICSEPIIHLGRSISEEESCQVRGGLEIIVDVLIRSLWEIQTESSINIRFVYADADTYKYEPMDKFLAG